MNNLIKLLVFDVDGTLSIGQNEIEREVSHFLYLFEKKGIRVCLASGKDYYYLTALSRGIGLKNPYYIAENGGILFTDTKRIANIDERVEESLYKIKRLIDEKFTKIWFQPNEACLTILSNGEGIILEIEQYIKSYCDLREFKIFTHYSEDCSSIDILPQNIDKAVGLCAIMKKMQITSSGVIVAGDSQSDMQMAQYANLMLIVGNETTHFENVKRFNYPIEMMRFLYKNICTSALYH